MTAQRYQPSADGDLAASLSRSYLAALAVLGDAAEAEAMVIEAVESLDPRNVTTQSLRDALVQRLVQAQLNMALAN